MGQLATEQAIGDERGQRKAEFSSALDRALRLCTEQDSADALGVSRAYLRKLRTAGSGRSLAACDLTALPRPVALVLLAELASQMGCGLAPLPAAAEETSDVAAMGKLAKESGEALAALGEALADGYLTASEATAVEREMDDVMAAAAWVKHRMRRVQRERVSGVRVVRQ